MGLIHEHYYYLMIVEREQVSEDARHNVRGSRISQTERRRASDDSRDEIGHVICGVLWFLLSHFPSPSFLTSIPVPRNDYAATSALRDEGSIPPEVGSWSAPSSPSPSVLTELTELS